MRWRQPEASASTVIVRRHIVMIGIVGAVLIGLVLQIQRWINLSMMDPLPSPVKVRLSVLSATIDSFQLDHGRGPVALNDLLQPNGNPDSKPYTTPDRLLDPWGEPIRYVCIAPDCKLYEITSLGSDRKPGGTGHAQDTVLNASGDFTSTSSR
jgi:type II secretory pathway pseudopilin PulG